MVDVIGIPDKMLFLPPLRNFKKLCALSISYSGDIDIPKDYCLQEIATVIDASPGLANLSIRSNSPAVLNCTSLQSKSRPELVQLDLVHVPLSNTGIKEILSHKLQQLSISTPPGGRYIKFDWNGLWSALQKIGIKLTILDVSGTENAIDKMFTYLLSYTGLQSLAIRDLRMDTREMEDMAARRFWHRIIPQHRYSLTTLFVTPDYESEWCYGPRVEVALKKCSSLQDLTISVRNVHSFWAKKKLSEARKFGVEFRDLGKPDGAVENCGVRTSF
jgi:hypothetical protein